MTGVTGMNAGEGFRVFDGLGHFMRRDLPRGFLWRFALAYGLLSMIVQVLAGSFQLPIYEIYLRAFIENEGEFTPYLDELNAASLRANIGSVLVLPITFAMWVLFEAASQRRFIRREGFRLRLGADEGRLAVVALLWFALIFALYIAGVIAIVIPVLAGSLAGGFATGLVIGGIIFLVLMVSGVYVYARLSAASALTVRDRQIRFFESWSFTKGSGWKLTAAYLLLLLAAFIIMSLLYLALGIAGFGLVLPSVQGLSGSALADGILAALSRPSVWAPLAFLLFLVLTVSGALAHAMAGPGALIVRMRTQEGSAELAQTFS